MKKLGLKIRLGIFSSFLILTVLPCSLSAQQSPESAGVVVVTPTPPPTTGRCDSMPRFTLPDEIKLSPKTSVPKRCTADGLKITNIGGKDLGWIPPKDGDALLKVCVPGADGITFTAKVNLTLPKSKPRSGFFVTVGSLPAGLKLSGDTIGGTISLSGTDSLVYDATSKVIQKCERLVTDKCCDHVFKFYNKRRVTANPQFITVKFTMKDSRGTTICEQIRNIKLAGGSYDYWERTGTTCSTKTPLALDLTSNGLELSSPSLVSFKLEAAQKEKTLWYGSEHTPLIVWDPEGTGKILDGKQLFGSWTFGKTFEDGYAALASLDKDGNSKLEGLELLNVRLWFDNNANGASEEGEVVDLADYEIISLSTESSGRSSDEFYGLSFAYAESGFEKKTDEGTSTGRTVDWSVPDLSELAHSSWKTTLDGLRAKGFTVLEYHDNPRWSGNRGAIEGYLVFRESTAGNIEGSHFSAVVTEEGGIGDEGATAKADGDSRRFSVSKSDITGVKKGDVYRLILLAHKSEDPKRELTYHFTKKADGTYEGHSLLSEDKDASGRVGHSRKVGLVIREAKTPPAFLK